MGTDGAKGVMSPSSPSPNAQGEIPLGDLLDYLEHSERAGEARLETSAGGARVWFRDHRLVDIELGEWTGRDAVSALTEAVVTSYSIEYRSICRFPALDDACMHELGREPWRADEWQRLVATMPSLDSVLFLNESRFARERGSLSEIDLTLLGLVDGRRAVIDVVSDSGLELVAATQRLAWYCRVGMVRASRGSRPPLSSTGTSSGSDAGERGDGAQPPLPAIPPAARLPNVDPDAAGRQPETADRAAPSTPGGDRPSIQPARMIAVGDERRAAMNRRRTASRTQVGLGAPRPPGGSEPPPGGGDPKSPPHEPSREPQTPRRPQDRAEPAEAMAGEAEVQEAQIQGLTAPRFTEELEPPSEGFAVLRGSPDTVVLPPERVAQATLLGRGSERVVLGRYEVLGRIARGGMGSVYLCRARGEGGFRRLFALKVLRGHLARDRDAARMFLEEARVASRIYHPHVVGIIDVGSHGSQPYIVMDYVEGGSLQQLLERHTEARPPRLIVPIVLDALSGLHAVHTLEDDDGAPLHLVHCDVSPQNLLVGLDGSCRLSDFGVAQMMRSAHAPHRAKPGYVAPEQLEDGDVDARTDVFSMGVVLWTALTGEPLFEAETMEATLYNVRKKIVPPPSSIGLCPPECFDDMCLKALSREPDDRYQSAGEMLQELRAVAMAEDHLAPTTEIADWVRATLGAEVQARRMAVLDASRRGRAPGAVTRALPDVDRPSVPPGDRSASGPPGGSPSSGPPGSSMPPSAAKPRAPVAATMVLKPRRDLRKVVVVTVAACLVLTGLVLAFPEWVSGLFRIEESALGPAKAAGRGAGAPTAAGAEAGERPGGSVEAAPASRPPGAASVFQYRRAQQPPETAAPTD